MTALVAWVVLVPALTAAACLMAWRSPHWQRFVGVAGSLAHLASAVALLVAVDSYGVLALQMGSWPAPFGITLVADTLSAIMVVLGAGMGLAVAVYSLADIDPPRARFAYFPLLHILLMGVSGAFVTGDIFNLYVFFEVMLIASFVLLSLGGTRAQLVGSMHYVTLNLISSIIFLVAAGLLYGVAGTLNMAELHRVLPAVADTHPAIIAAAGALLLVSFAIKSGIFPFYFWLPASYHTPPAAVSAIFAGLLTKVGVYALVRACTLILPVDVGGLRILLVLAGFTMALGVLGAVSQFEIRRILGFHIISQIGYMVLGLSLLLAPDLETRRLALAGTVFYITHHILVKTNLYLVGGTVAHLGGTFELGRLGGLAKRAPWLAVLFLIPAFSLAGVPPLSGFWAKLAVIQAGLEAEQYGVVVVAVLAGLLTLLSMIKIWNEAFWKPVPDGDAAAHGNAAPGTDRASGTSAAPDAEAAQLSEGSGVATGGESPGVRPLAALVVPAVVLAAGTLAIGLVPEPLFALASRAAEQLLDPAAYLHAVLGGGR